MPNPDHLSILKQGINKWNAWRASSSEQPDLTAAILKRRDLRGVQLCNANLAGADLREAILYHADLSGARLRGARLVRGIVDG